MSLLPITLAARLAGLLTGLLARLARPSGELAEAMALAHARLTRLLTRLDRLVQQAGAGTLPQPRAPRPNPPRRAPRPPTPNGFGWLARLAPPPPQLAGQVALVLVDPQTRALVESAPRAGRLLRPLCRALGLHPPEYLRLPGYRAPRDPTPPRRPPPPPWTQPIIRDLDAPVIPLAVRIDVFRRS